VTGKPERKFVCKEKDHEKEIMAGRSIGAHYDVCRGCFWEKSPSEIGKRAVRDQDGHHEKLQLAPWVLTEKRRLLLLGPKGSIMPIHVDSKNTESIKHRYGRK